ncbi:unnamed protein product [Camellia sinensis]
MKEAMTIVDTSGTPTKLQGKYAAMVVCWILGLGALIAWNSILTIGDYYYKLFPRYHPARVLPLLYLPFSIATMGILSHNVSKIKTRWRNLTRFSLFFIATLGLLVLDLATSGKGGIGNYIGICIIVAAFGVADGHVQGGLVGDLSFMCPEFIQSFLAGYAASGVLASALRLISKAVFERSADGLRKGARVCWFLVISCWRSLLGKELADLEVLFLAISTFFEFLCIFLYAFVFPKLPIVKHYRLRAASEGSTNVTADLAAAGIQTEATTHGGEDDKQQQRLSNKQLFIENIDYAVDLYLTCVLTLSIFPGFLYENTGSHHQLGSWYALVLVAMYNVWNLISRYIPLVKCLEIKSRNGLMIATLSRFFLIPAFYFTANYGSQGWMIMLTSFLGLTNGYLNVCVLTQAPKGYKSPEQNALGNLLVLCIQGGILSGVALDWLWLIGSKHQF